MSEHVTIVDDRGSVMLLAIGAVAVAALMLVIGVDASAAFLQRRALTNLADATALAGAQGIDLDAYYRDGVHAQTRLDPASVRARVASFLHGSDASAMDGLRLDGVISDGTSVTVRLSAPLKLPFSGAWAADRVTVEAGARLAYRAGA